jgi:hypothetical protein
MTTLATKQDAQDTEDKIQGKVDGFKKEIAQMQELLGII